MPRTPSLDQTVARRVAEVIEKYGDRIYRDAVKFAPYKTGALERSIECRKRVMRQDWWKSQVELSVPSGSEAGKYAYIIHSLRYVKWWNRGPGTVAKGRQAKELFFDRAVDKWEARMTEAVHVAAGKGLEEFADELFNRNARAK